MPKSCRAYIRKTKKQTIATLYNKKSLLLHKFKYKRVIIYMEPLKREIMTITSWSDEQLEKLCNPRNHRIRYDGFEYWWEHKLISNNWDVHYLEGFKDYRVPSHWLKVWLYNWLKELTERRIKSSKIYLKEMQQYLKATEEAINIANKPGMKTKTKIKTIQELLPNETVTAMADMLKISTQALHKHLRDEN